MSTPKRYDVHTPKPIVPTAVYPAAEPIAVQQYAAPVAVPTVQSVLLPDGRVVTGYAMAQQQPAAVAEPARSAVSPVAVNIALGGVGFAAVCGGLLLLTSFIAALAALVAQLVILAAVIFGGFIAVQVLGTSGKSKPGTTVNIRKAVFKRNNFRG
ncbi:hypothetical protein [Actinacidiphila oryziradicis]|uniref:Uncharacterized protein n=1 Tax=Actinacidiphila oryziradicis TaxID=2571141 RepID=A0A4U0ST32_9ACTN|nr:hypothetical protein [Actinacidiphila oryziradicis]TKA13176.1 hypothetical protein FCI23_00060 [Actinacidiphila oryziradicis]